MNSNQEERVKSLFKKGITGVTMISNITGIPARLIRKIKNEVKPERKK